MATHKTSGRKARRTSRPIEEVDVMRERAIIAESFDALSLKLVDDLPVEPGRPLTPGFFPSLSLQLRGQAIVNEIPEHQGEPVGLIVRTVEALDALADAACALAVAARRDGFLSEMRPGDEVFAESRRALMRDRG